MKVLQYALVSMVLAVMTAFATETRADQAAQAYWVCSDADGRKTAQDHPCDAAHPQQDRRVVHSANPSVLPSPGSPVSAVADVNNLLSDSTSLNHLAPRSKWLIGGCGLVALLVLLVFALRRPGGGRESADTEKQRSPARSGMFPALTGRPRAWSLELIRSLEWKRFQALCAALWSAEGYRAEQTGDGSDNGIDVRLYAAGDADKPALIIQCKPQRSKPVAVNSVRELFSSIHSAGAKEGILATSAEFAADTMIYAGGKSITLVDGDMLLKKLQSLGAAEQARLLKEITRGDYRTPSCPQCGAGMVKRRSSEGAAEGALWACRKHPDCERRFAFEP